MDISIDNRELAVTGIDDRELCSNTNCMTFQSRAFPIVVKKEEGQCPGHFGCQLSIEILSFGKDLLSMLYTTSCLHKGITLHDLEVGPVASIQGEGVHGKIMVQPKWI